MAISYTDHGATGTYFQWYSLFILVFSTMPQGIGEFAIKSVGDCVFHCTAMHNHGVAGMKMQ